MTSRKTCLNVSINKRFAALICLLTLTGCAQTPPIVPRPTLTGTVDLSRLVVRHPDWRRVAALDAALSRLPSAPLVLRSATLPPPSLPALSAAAPPAASRPVAATLRRLAAVRLARTQQRRERLAAARRLELERAREGLERDADTRYAQRLRDIQSAYLAQFGQIFRSQDAGWLNLKMQVDALHDTVTDPLWLQAIPPTPILDAAQRELARKQAELAAYEARWASEKADVRGRRDAQIAAASAERAASVRDALDARERTLRQADEARLAAQSALLIRRRDALARADESVFAAPPPAAPLGTLTLPAPPERAPSAAATGKILTATRANLEAQRRRWVKFLTDETRASALDAARAQGWKVTGFAAPAPGVPDLTPRIAATLTRGLWRS